MWNIKIWCCCCSFVQSCPTLCDLLACSMPSHCVPHHLPEFAQIHVHCIGDAIQPSDPLTPSSPSALDLSQHQGLFQLVVCLHQMTKILELQLQHQSFQWMFRVDRLKINWFDLLAVQGTLRSLLQHHSSKALVLWRSAFFTVQLSQPYMTTGKTVALTVWTFVCRVCLCFLTHCLGLSSLSCQEAIVFWFHGCSHCLQWFWSPRRGNVSTSTFPLLFGIQ